MGRRFPIDVSFRYKGDEYRPDDFLQAVPAGAYLRENNQYALVVTRKISPEHGRKLTPNKMLNALLKGQSARSVDRWVSHARAEDAAQTYGALAAQWAAEGRNPDDIIGATAWTTGSPSKVLRNIVAKAAEWPVKTPNTEISLKEESAEYCVLEASWTVPQIQTGRLPYATPLAGGSVSYDVQGSPIITGQRSTPMILTIPKAPMPEAGYPMAFYHHGTDGRATQVYTRGTTLADGTATREGSVAELAATRGWAASGMGGHMSADHQDQLPLLNWVLDLNDFVSLNMGEYNFLNMKAMRGNIMQSGGRTDGPSAVW